jgi:hypothetical protein
MWVRCLITERGYLSELFSQCAFSRPVGLVLSEAFGRSVRSCKKIVSHVQCGAKQKVDVIHVQVGAWAVIFPLWGAI